MLAGASSLASTATKLPLPLRVSMTPASLRICRALRTVMRLTPHHLIELFLAGEQVPFLVHALRDHAFDLLQHLRIQLDAGFDSILIGHKIFFFLF